MCLIKSICAIKNKVAVIKLNDPSKLNALSVDVKRDLNLFLKELENRDDVEVIVLTGSGKAFCAGGDVKGMGERTTIESLEKISNTTNISLIIQSIKKPVIAAVNGYALVLDLDWLYRATLYLLIRLLNLD